MLKKKLFTYLSLFVMMGTFLTTPLTVFAETTDNSIQQTQPKSTLSETVKSEEKKKASYSQVENNTKQKDKVSSSKFDTLESTQTDQRQQSESTQSTDQQTRAPSRVNRVAHNTVITSFTITDKDGKPLDHDVKQWENFRIKGEFTLSDNQVHERDTTTLTLPEKIQFSNTENFDLKDSDGNVVAHATINPNTKTIVFTYTNYVELHSSISGEFYFYARVDTKVVKEKTPIEISIDVDGNLVPAGDIDYDGPGEKIESNFDKSGWMDDNNNRSAWYYLAVNRSRKKFTNVKITDNIQSSRVTIDKDSFLIEKGTWRWDEGKGDWILDSPTDVTKNFKIEMTDNDTKFFINIDNISRAEGYTIKYKVKIDYEPSDGEIFKNKAIMSSSTTITEEVEREIRYQKGGGNAEGYHFTIKIHKKDEAGNSLRDAEFTIIRDQLDKEVQTITTDANGNGQVSGLLRDNYTIKETKAPDGYELSNEEIKISPKDFDSNKEVFKEIINKKKQSEPANIALKANKILTGKALTAGAFNFELKNENGKVVQTKANDTNGAINFDAISYDKANTYNYTISEAKGTEAGMTYDEHVIKVSVVVEDKDGKLVVTATYEGEKDFKNTYKPVEPNKPNNPSPPTKPGKNLPMTGEQSTILFTLLGVIILLFVSGAVYYQKRKHV